MSTSPTDDLIDHAVIEQLFAILSEQETYIILSSCLTDVEQRVASIRALKMPEDMDQFKWNAHDLKTSSGQIGAIGLQQLAEEVEIYCKNLGDGVPPDTDFLKDRQQRIINTATDVSDIMHNHYMCKADASQLSTGT